MRRILAILLLLALLCGCTGQGIPAGENQLTFYYRRADGTNDESFASETGALTEKRVTDFQTRYTSPVALYIIVHRLRQTTEKSYMVSLSK